MTTDTGIVASIPGNQAAVMGLIVGAALRPNVGRRVRLSTGGTDDTSSLQFVSSGFSYEIGEIGHQFVCTIRISDDQGTSTNLYLRDECPSAATAVANDLYLKPPGGMFLYPEFDLYFAGTPTLPWPDLQDSIPDPLEEPEIPVTPEMEILVEVSVEFPPKSSRRVVGQVGEKRRATFQTAFADDLNPTQIE